MQTHAQHPRSCCAKVVFKGMFFLHTHTHTLHIGGKRDEELILPLNSSLSATLDQNQVNANRVDGEL